MNNNINSRLHISKFGIEVLKHFEGSNMQSDGYNEHIAYLCPASRWSIGYGHSIRLGSEFATKYNCTIKMLQCSGLWSMSDIEATKLLKRDLITFEDKVKREINISLNQNQFDALVLFVYNCWHSDTLFSMINSRSSIEEIVFWWSTHWITINKNVAKGLVRRRVYESLLFAFGVFPYE